MERAGEESGNGAGAERAGEESGNGAVVQRAGGQCGNQESGQMARWLLLWNSLISGGIYLSYPSFLIFVLIRRRQDFLPYLLIPAAGFFLLSWIRAKINAPRPYEGSGKPPLIPKETRGNSFPSRHVFCIFLLAATYGTAFLPAGIATGLLGILLAFIRVRSGVHYKKDVVAGAVSALVFAGICYAAAGLL